MKLLRAGHDPKDPIDEIEFVPRELTELGLRMVVPQGWASFFASIKDRQPSFILEKPTLIHASSLLVIVMCFLDCHARTEAQLKINAQRIIRQVNHRRARIRRARYGQLSGYECTYECSQRVDRSNIQLQERVFYGHQLGKPLVVLQATTTRPGSLSQWDPMVRHLWNSVRYLNRAAVKAAIRAKPAARKIRAQRRVSG